MPDLTALATLLVRLLGCTLVLLGFGQAVANLFEGFIGFDPTYLGHFFTSQLLRPALALLGGGVLLLGAKPLGRWLSRGL